jgi:hypothetical protein
MQMQRWTTRPGKWHAARWAFDGRNYSLSLDGAVVVRQTPLREYPGSFPVRIGQYLDRPQYAFRTFHGCIRNIEIRSTEP